MYSSPQITFILPIYNVEPYLADAIESILHQSISKEIILVNDGSTDNCLNIALHYTYQYPFITLIHSQNRGVSAARNAGLAIARGEFVYFLDPDDLLETQTDFSIVYRFAKENNLQVIKGQIIHFLPNQKRLLKPTYPLQPKQFQTDSLKGFLWHSLKHNRLFLMGSYLYNRQFLVQNALRFNETLSANEDSLFHIEMLSCEGNIAELPWIFFHYRKRTDKVLISPNENAVFNDLGITQYLWQKAEKTQDPLLQKILFATTATYCYQLKETIESLPICVQANYKHHFTPEMQALCEQFNVGRFN